jgi:hypothetical protein
MVTISPPPFRRSRRPESKSPASSPAVVGVRIIGVQEEGGAARWIFDTRTATQSGLPTGLRVDGRQTDIVYDFTPFTLLLNYPDGIEVGDPWDIVLSVTGITFAGGLLLLPGQSGIVQ